MNATLQAPLKITAILSIVDTRHFEEVGDTWKPIPGSGDEHACHRCGRNHEVHATVRLEDGTEAVVGTGCAGADNVEMAAKFSSLDRAVKRLAMIRAQRADWLAKCEAWDLAFAAVQALPLPEIVQVPCGGDPGPGATAWKMGEVQVFSHRGGLTEERRACLVDHWQRSQLPTHRPFPRRDFNRDVQRLEDRIDALKKV